ncbi:MAG: iron chelate uptake ABC transporter family permease subunit [Nitrospira sp.]
MNAIFSALIMFITSILDPNRSYGMMAWLMGTLTSPTYSGLVGVLVYLSISLIFLFRQMRALNILALGEDAARSLGIDRTGKALHLHLDGLSHRCGGGPLVA